MRIIRDFMKKRKLEMKKFTPKWFYQKRSFSQCGEDIILSNIFHHICKNRPVKYIDIGANQPFSLSNTAYFYFKNRPKGGGVLVEPNHELASILRMRRRRDTVLNVGISDNGKSQKKDFYVMDAHVLSTFSKNEAEEYKKIGYKIEKVIKVKTVGINSIFKQYFPQGNIDLMNLDTEGFDLQILKQIDYKKYKPKVICVETVDYRALEKQKKDNDIVKFLLSKDYLVYADTYINTILVDKRYYNSDK